MKNKVLASSYEKISSVSLAFVVFMLCGFIVYYYVSQERFIYYWDYRGYWDTTQNYLLQWKNDPWQAIELLKSSMSSDYNLIPTLAILPFMAIFGTSRKVYIVAISLVYLFPYAVTNAWLSKQIFSNHQWFSGNLTLFVSIFTPAVLLPVFRGYPDIGAAIFISLAIGLHFISSSDKVAHRKRLLLSFLVGGSLVLSILFRRHFIYAVVALVIVFCIDMLIKIVSQPFSSLKPFVIYYLGVGLGGTVTLAILGIDFVRKLVTVNYNSLYKSYQEPVISVISFFVLSVGLISWIIIGFGYLIRLKNAGAYSKVQNKNYYFLLFYLVSWLVIWVLVSRQTSPHFVLHITFVVVLGIVGFLVGVKTHVKKRSIRVILYSIIMIFGLLNFWQGVSKYDFCQISGCKFSSSFFARKEPPLVRNDCDQILGLVQYLRDTVSDTDYVLVNGSSGILNDDIIRKAEETMYGLENTKLNLLYVPHIDSRDSYPLEQLLRAEYVVVPSPFQHHLAEQEQDVVKVIHDIFIDEWEVSHDFDPLEKKFELQGGVTVTIYKRKHRTELETALYTFSEMSKYVGERPGNQSNWIVLDETYFTNVESDEILTHPSDSSLGTKTLFLFIGMPTEQYLSGNLEFLDPLCKGIAMATEVYNVDNKVIHTIASEKFSPSDSAFQKFTLKFGSRGLGDFQLLEIKEIGPGESIHNCTIRLSNLQ